MSSNSFFPSSPQKLLSHINESRLMNFEMREISSMLKLTDMGIFF